MNAHPPLTCKFGVPLLCIDTVGVERTTVTSRDDADSSVPPLVICSGVELLTTALDDVEGVAKPLPLRVNNDRACDKRRNNENKFVNSGAHPSFKAIFF